MKKKKNARVHYSPSGTTSCVRAVGIASINPSIPAVAEEEDEARENANHEVVGAHRGQGH
jgi:hypothetical protein